MQITVKFHSGLEKQIKDYDKEKGIIMKLDFPERIESIVQRYIPEDAWGVVGVVVLLNKKITGNDYQVRDGDMIELFPLSGGG